MTDPAPKAVPPQVEAQPAVTPNTPPEVVLPSKPDGEFDHVEARELEDGTFFVQVIYKGHIYSNTDASKDSALAQIRAYLGLNKKED